MILTLKEFAEKYKVAERVVSALCRKKKLKAVKIGKVWRIEDKGEIK